MKDIPHGTRSRYVNRRCRCIPCRAAQNEYQRDRIAKVRAGIWQRPVSARRVRQHLFYLSSHGVGRRTVSDITGLSMRVLADYKRGRRKRIGRANEKLILSITKKALYDRKLVPLTATERIVQKLMKEGFLKFQIATRAGISPSVLSKRKGYVFARTEMKLEQFYNRVTAEAAA